jgi:hypothetical protein
VQVTAVVVAQVAPPGAAVTVYPVITEPPLLTGAVHETAVLALPPTPVTTVGAPGTVAPGVTVAEAEDAIEFPTVLVAITVKV